MLQFPRPNFRRDVGRLFRFLTLYLEEAPFTLARATYSFATEKHRIQVRSDGAPYIVHPVRVASYLLKYSRHQTQEAVAVALLHDLVEDCDVSLLEVAERFGEDVARDVGWLTRVRSPEESPLERAHGKARKLASLNEAPALVRAVKCFDILDNVLSWKYVCPDHAHFRKLPRWMSEAIGLYAPFCRDNQADVASLIEAEIALLRGRGVTPGPRDGY